MFFLMKGNVCGFAGVWENQNAHRARLKGDNPRARPLGEGQREKEGLHLNFSLSGGFCEARDPCLS